MKNLILGVVFAFYAQACSAQTSINNDLFFIKSTNGNFELIRKAAGGEKKILSTDALNVHYDVYPVLDRGKPALFFFEMWEAGNEISIYNIEEDSWILQNYELVNTKVEISKSDNKEFILFLTDEGFREKVPNFVLPVLMKVVDDKNVINSIDCESDVFITSVKRSKKFLIDNQAQLKSSTKSIIAKHFESFEKRCE